MTGFAQALAVCRQADDPAAKGRRFEELIRDALAAHPGEYGPARFERVWLWQDWPDREEYGYAGDIGVDLVAEQTDEAGGGLCAVQCKMYDSAKVSARDVDKFLAATLGDEWRSRIFVATGDYTPASEKKLTAAPGTEILTSAKLDGWDVDWERLASDRGVEPEFAPPAHEPRPDQLTAVDSVRAGLAAPGSRGCLVMPCGTGKSAVALWSAEQIAGTGGRVLYLVPSLSLMDQTMREWAGQRSLRQSFLGVCSDTKVGRRRTDGDVLISALSMPTTTDAAKVGAWCKPDRPEAMRVVFSTYQSLPKIAEAQADHGCPGFDLVVCDEAHRTTGVERSGEDASAWTLVHDQTRVDCARRLYMTATPKVYTEAAKARRAEDETVFSMDDESRYGPELYRQSFGDAIAEGLLSDFEVLVVGVDESTLGGMLGGPAAQTVTVPSGDGETTTVGFEDALKMLGCWDAFADPTSQGPTGGRSAGETAATVEPIRKVIAFANRIKDSRAAADCWGGVADRLRPSAGDEADLLPLDVRHVDGGMNAWERETRLGWLRSAAADGDGTRVLTNAQCLSEGVDVPALDAVVFLKPKAAEVDIVQAVGRVMRRAPGKRKGYVVVPVLIPAGELMNSDRVLEGSDFKQVWKVLRALRSHDSRLDVQVNTLSRAERAPVRILDPTCEPDDDGQLDQRWVQDRLALDPELSRKVASAIVANVGDSQYWPSWGRSAAGVYTAAEKLLDTAAEGGGGKTVRGILGGFVESMRKTAVPAFTDDDARRMICQHVVTLPVFDAFFSGHQFAAQNPVSKHLNGVISGLASAGVVFDEATAPMQGRYESIRRVFANADDPAERLDLLRKVYESFLKAAVPDVVDRLGIVYTPIEIVDFMLRSVDAVCRQEFGRGLTDRNVHILDPFAGTGTYLARLLSIRRSDDEDSPFLIDDADVARKYSDELHAYEITMLPYYLAALNMEGAAERRGAFSGPGRYQPFGGIVLADTFATETDTMRSNRESRRQATLELGLQMHDNAERASRMDSTPIKVIVGNPPWSAGQKSSGDDNPRADNPGVAQRVRETYGKAHKDVTKRSAGGNAAGNLYVQAFRWATDRMMNPPEGEDEGWVVAFVHPSSVIHATSLAGMRKTLRDEFSAVYVIDLAGDAAKSGEEWRREGDVVFAATGGSGGSRNGVQITVAVRDPSKTGPQQGRIFHARVPERQTREAKFGWLNGHIRDVASGRLDEAPLNDRHDWVNIGDGSFERMLPLCDTDKINPGVAVRLHARGVGTDCDAWVYSPARTALEDRIRSLLDAYETARAAVHDTPLAAGETLAGRVAAASVNDNLPVIKWTGQLKATLKRGDRLEFDPDRIREVLYRPFTKLWLYEDDRILSSVKTVSAMFPRERERERERSGHASSSPARPAERSSQPSQHGRSPTSAQPEPTSRAERSSGDPDLGAVEHGDPRDVGDGSAAGSALPGSRPADESAAAAAIVAASQQTDAADSVLAVDGLADLNVAGPNRGGAGSSPDHGGRRRRSLQPDRPPPAVLVSSPSSRTVFSALATTGICDLHALDPACRAAAARRL